LMFVAYQQVVSRRSDRLRSDAKAARDSLAMHEAADAKHKIEDALRTTRIAADSAQKEADLAKADVRRKEEEKRELRQSIMIAKLKVVQEKDPSSGEVALLVALEALQRANEHGGTTEKTEARTLAQSAMSSLPTLRWQHELKGDVSALISTGGALLAFGQRLSTAEVWIGGRTDGKRISGPSVDPNASFVAASPDGRWTVWTSGEDLKLWDISSGQRTVATDRALSRRTSVALSPDGRWLLTSALTRVRDSSGTRLWDLRAGTARGIDPRGALTLAFSPDGQTFATGAADGSIRVMKTGSTSETPLQLKDSSAVRHIVFSPDGKYVAAAGNSVQVWPINAPAAAMGANTVPDNRSASRAVTALAFSVNGRLLANARNDGSLEIADVQQTLGAKSVAWLTVVSAAEKNPPINALAFSPDGRWLATGGSDKTARIWSIDAFPRRPQERFRVSHQQGVRAIAFLADGAIASGDETGLVKVSEVTSATTPVQSASNDILNQACSRVSRAMTAAEWDYYFPYQPGDEYRSACSRYTVGATEILNLLVTRAGAGNVEGANVAHRQFDALNDSATRELDPAAVVSAAVVQDSAGNRADAGALLGRASRLALTARGSDSVKALTNNDVCWRGGIHDFADVVRANCESAVKLGDPVGLPHYRDSRGVVYALRGDIANAIRDFQSFIDKDAPDTTADGRRRIEWVKRLKTGQNPFAQDKKRTLDALRSADGEFVIQFARPR
jgi:WD40 repeat protein